MRCATRIQAERRFLSTARAMERITEGEHEINRRRVLFIGITTGDLIRYYVHHFFADEADEADESNEEDEDSSHDAALKKPIDWPSASFANGIAICSGIGSGIGPSHRPRLYFTRIGQIDAL